MSINRNDPLVQNAERLIKKGIDDRVRPLAQKLRSLEQQVADLARRLEKYDQVQISDKRHGSIL